MVFKKSDLKKIFDKKHSTSNSRLNLECKKEQLMLVIEKLDKITAKREKEYLKLYSSDPVINRIHDLYSDRYVFKEELLNAKKQTLEIEKALNDLKEKIKNIKT